MYVRALSTSSLGNLSVEKTATNVPHLQLACLLAGLPGVFKLHVKMYMWKEIWMITLAVVVMVN